MGWVGSKFVSFWRVELGRVYYSKSVFKANAFKARLDKI